MPPRQYIAPCRGYFERFMAIQTATGRRTKKGVRAEIANLEENRQLVSRIPKTNNPILVAEYEKGITENVGKINKLKDDLNKIKYPPEKFQTAVRVVFDYLKNPLTQWNNPNYQKKRLLLGMYFENKIAFDPEKGFKPLICL